MHQKCALLEELNICFIVSMWLLKALRTAQLKWPSCGKIHCKFQTLLIHPMNSLVRPLFHPPPHPCSTQQLIQLFFRLHINASIFPSVDPTTNFINSCLRPINVFIYPFIRPSTYVFIHSFIHPPSGISIYSLRHPSIHMNSTIWVLGRNHCYSFHTHIQAPLMPHLQARTRFSLIRS